MATNRADDEIVMDDLALKQVVQDMLKSSDGQAIYPREDAPGTSSQTGSNKIVVVDDDEYDGDEPAEMREEAQNYDENWTVSEVLLYSILLKNNFTGYNVRR